MAYQAAPVFVRGIGVGVEMYDAQLAAANGGSDSAAVIPPKNGATDVDPGLRVIRVEFDTPMSTDGYSFTGGGPTFPSIPEGQRPRWSRDGKTCTLPVELKPDAQYELGINSISHKNFASRWGVPLEPVVYKFHTSPGKE